MNHLDTAISLGFSIFPVGIDKKPLLGMRWKQYQQTAADREQIERWKRLNPLAWAVITGAVSRLVVVDFDGIDGRLLSVMNRMKPHVQTPSGGFHQWFVHPGWPVSTLNCRAKKELGEAFPGLDIRGDGGYAVFTGRLPKGEYRWLREMKPDPLEVCPERIRAALGLLHPPRAPRPTRKGVPICPSDPSFLADTLIRKALDLAGAKGRNNAAFWLAVQARDNGFSFADDYIVRQFHRLSGPRNLKGALEPFTEKEALEAWSHAFKTPAREPWTRQRRTS